MTRRAARTVFLSTLAEFSNGMAAAWAFASYDAVHRFAWADLLSSLFLAILSFSFSIGIRLKLVYDKHP